MTESHSVSEGDIGEAYLWGPEDGGLRVLCWILGTQRRIIRFDVMEHQVCRGR